MKFLLSLCLLVLLISACSPATEPATPTIAEATLPEFQDFSYRMIWSSDDRLIALTTNTGLYVYETSAYKQVAAFDGLGGSTAVFGTNTLAAVNSKGIFVWSLADFSPVFTKADSDTHFQTLAISPDDKVLVTAEQTRLSFWDLPGGELLADVDTDNSYVNDLVFTDANTLLVAEVFSGTVQKWDIRSQTKTELFEVQKPAVNFNLSEAGNVMVVDYGDYGFELWDVETGKAIQEYPDIIGAPGWNNLSGDDQTVVVWGYGIGSDSGMSVWDLAVSKQIFEIPTPMVNGDGWRCGALNSDGSILAASNNAGYIYFYEVQSGKEVGEILLPYKFTG